MKNSLLSIILKDLLRASLVTAVCALCWSPSASAESADSTEVAIEAADAMLHNKSYQNAIDKYQEIADRLTKETATDPDTAKQMIARCYRKQGVAYSLLQNHERAVISFNKALSAIASESGNTAVKEKIYTQYSLARAYESAGEYEKALDEANDALAGARIELSKDDPNFVRRLIALRTELYLSHIANKLEPEMAQEKNDTPEQFSAEPVSSGKPLVGGVSEQDYFKAPALMSEVPSLDGQKKQPQALDASANKTSLSSGTKKVKNKLVQKLMEYGTMGLSLKKDLPGFPWYVKYVLDGGAAQRYGAKDGDILNTIDGHPIATTPIATIYHMLCGRRGEVRTLGINRGGKDMFLRVQLISVYDIGTQSSEYIEYYWFLLYNGYITNEQYAKLAKPWERYLH
ncbi:hypothetical protein GC174_05755 [bacterium]|nr:hypothetical protein [bacterium]